MDNNFNYHSEENRNEAPQGGAFPGQSGQEQMQNQPGQWQRELGQPGQWQRELGQPGSGQQWQSQPGQWQPSQPQSGQPSQPQSSQTPSSYSGFRPYTSYQPAPEVRRESFEVSFPERRALKSQYFGVFSKGLIHAVGSFVLAQAFFIFMSLNGYEFRTNDEGAQIMDWQYFLAATIPSVTVCMLVFFVDMLRQRIGFKSCFSTGKITSKSVLGFFGAFTFAFSAGQISQYIIYIICLSFGVSPISQSYATAPQYDTPYFISTIIMTVIIAPIAEELLFRGVILGGLSRISGRFAIFMSAAMFGLMHGNLPQAFCAFVMGVLFGYAAVKTDSLVLPIAGHIMANLISTSTMFVEYFLGEDMSNTYWFAVLGLFGLIGLICFIVMLTKGYIRFPEYSEYHVKRTMPIVVTCISFWLVMLFYVGDIILKFEVVEW